VEVVLAHDIGWFEEHRKKGVVFPGKNKQVKALERVEVVLAHDIGWFEEHRKKGVVFPGKIKTL